LFGNFENGILKQKLALDNDQELKNILNLEQEMKATIPEVNYY